MIQINNKLNSYKKYFVRCDIVINFCQASFTLKKERDQSQLIFVFLFVSLVRFFQDHYTYINRKIYIYIYINILDFCSFCYCCYCFFLFLFFVVPQTCLACLFCRTDFIVGFCAYIYVRVCIYIKHIRSSYSMNDFVLKDLMKQIRSK